MTADVDELLDEIRYALRADFELLAEATVIAVDKEKGTCTVRLEGSEADISGVRLQGPIKEGGRTAVLYPKLESRVVVLKLAAQWQKAMLVQMGEVEEVNFSAGKRTLKVNDDAVELNGGKLGGMVVAEKLLAKLNKLEQLANDLLTAFNTHTHAETGGVTAVPSVLITSLPLAVTTIGEIENKEVLQ